jgi:hypothetical protein
MKSRYIASTTESEKIAIRIAREEVERQKKLVCPACEQSSANQVAAVMCKALSVRYGFGKQRLQQIITDTENLFAVCAADGKRFSALQAVEWLRDAMGIDLNKP